MNRLKMFYFFIAIFFAAFASAQEKKYNWGNAHLFDIKQSAGFLPSNSEIIPRAVKQRYSSVFVFLNYDKRNTDELRFDTCFFLENEGGLVTSRVNVYPSSTLESVKKIIEGGEELGKLKLDEKKRRFENGFDRKFEFMLSRSGVDGKFSVFFDNTEEKRNVKPSVYFDPFAVVLNHSFRKDDDTDPLALLFQTDFAVFPLPHPRKNIEGIKLAKKLPKVGDPIYVVGFPDETKDRRLNSKGGGVLQVAPGKVLSTERGMLLHNADFQQSIGGAPVLNADGELVGIVTGRIVSDEKKDEIKVLPLGPNVESLRRYTKEFPELKAKFGEKK